MNFDRLLEEHVGQFGLWQKLVRPYHHFEPCSIKVIKTISSFEKPGADPTTFELKATTPTL
jgi:hypothetical protein